MTGGGECTGAETQSCYEFDAATLGKGVCKGGTKSCKGGVFGACEGQVGPSAEDCSKPEDEDCDGVACSEAIWSKEFGEASSPDKNFADVEDLVVLANGNILVAGVFTSSINFGPTAATLLVCTPGHSNLFLAELGADGSHIWSERFEPQGDAALGARLAVSSTGQIFLSAFYKEAITLDGKVITATGSDGRDFFVASFDKDGKVIWGDTFGLDSQSFVADLAVGPDGDPIVVGQYGNGSLVLGATTYPSPVGYNAFVAKLAHTDGSVVWSHSYGDDPSGQVGNQSATAVAVDGTGNIVIAGEFNTTIELDGGFQGLMPEGGMDVFVAQTSSKGDPIWHTSFHGVNDDIVSSLAVDSMGSIYAAGAFAGTTHFDAVDITTTKTTTGPADVDLYLAKLTSQGKHAWMKQYGDATPQQAPNQLTDDATLTLGVDSKDNVLFAGGFLGTMQIGTAALTSAGDSDWFIGKLTTDGTHLWNKSFGDSSPAQFVAAVGADAKTGAVVLAGVNDGSLAIGPGAPLKAKGSLDVVVARLNP
ncbi:MAG: hypothetical protein ABJE95_03045 [Byssovorax sp.]